jgi:hypothetical protein
MSAAPSNTFHLLEDNDDDNDPLLQGDPIFATSRPHRKSAPPEPPLTNPPLTNPRAVSVTPATNHKRPPAASKPPAKKKKKKKSEMPHCLVWVCTHGKGQSRTWRQNDLKLVGVYSSKTAAEMAKAQVMSRHECCGHGDIIVGGSWNDEIDLVIREAPLFLDNDD